MCARRLPILPILDYPSPLGLPSGLPIPPILVATSPRRYAGACGPPVGRQTREVPGPWRKRLAVLLAA